MKDMGSSTGIHVQMASCTDGRCCRTFETFLSSDSWAIDMGKYHWSHKIPLKKCRDVSWNWDFEIRTRSEFGISNYDPACHWPRDQSCHHYKFRKTLQSLVKKIKERKQCKFWTLDVAIRFLGPPDSWRHSLWYTIIPYAQLH